VDRMMGFKMKMMSRTKFKMALMGCFMTGLRKIDDILPETGKELKEKAYLSKSLRAILSLFGRLGCFKRKSSSCS
jgi:hypothetical protein